MGGYSIIQIRHDEGPGQQVVLLFHVSHTVAHKFVELLCKVIQKYVARVIQLFLLKTICIIFFKKIISAFNKSEPLYISKNRMGKEKFTKYLQVTIKYT